jgi:hypothetical protein
MEVVWVIGYSPSKYNVGILITSLIYLMKNPKTQAPNSKWFDKPFDRLTVLSKVEGLTTPGQVEG